MGNFPKFFGTATVGAKGQVVIPLEARKSLNIKSGDKLIVMSGHSKHSKRISLARTDDFAQFLKQFEEHISTVKEEFYKKGK